MWIWTNIACILLQAQSQVNPDYQLQTIDPDSDFEACGAADLDNDGDLDIVCGDAWYESPDWKRHPIGLIRNVGGYRVDFADLPLDVDDDGYMDNRLLQLARSRHLLAEKPRPRPRAGTMEDDGPRPARKHGNRDPLGCRCRRDP